MPLFGKHHKNDNSTRHGRNDDHMAARNDPSLGAGTQEPYGATHNQGAFHNDGNNYGANGPMGNDYGRSGPGGGAGPGMGAGAGMGPGGTDAAVPPATHINPDNSHTSSSGGRLAGKAERGLGSLVGSQALKEKGFQKQHEAGAFKMQSAEIAEAERLEKEALMRRERAVAHGAHPDNRHLGGLQNANTLSDVAGGGQAGNAGGYGSGAGTY